MSGINVSWNLVELAVQKMVHDIKAMGDNYVRVVGVNPDGLIPAVIISKQLGLPLSVLSEQTLDGIDWVGTPLIVRGFCHDAPKTEHTVALFCSWDCEQYLSIGAIWPWPERLVFPWEKRDE